MLKDNESFLARTLRDLGGVIERARGKERAPKKRVLVAWGHHDDWSRRIYVARTELSLPDSSTKIKPAWNPEDELRLLGSVDSNGLGPIPAKFLEAIEGIQESAGPVELPPNIGENIPEKVFAVIVDDGRCYYDPKLGQERIISLIQGLNEKHGHPLNVF